MRKIRPYLALLAVVAGVLIVWLLLANRGEPNAFVVFDGAKPGCAIIVPREPTKEEWAAAQLLSDTLAKAAGRASFPVERENWWRSWQRGIFVGETTRAKRLPLPGHDPTSPMATKDMARLMRPVGCGVFPDGVILRSRWPEDIKIAASWFLEKHAGVHWFIPGPLGLAVPSRESLRLAAGVESVAPSFVSRNLGGLEAADGQAWFEANRLQAVITHGHSMTDIFRPEDVARLPELAPLVNWQKYFPTRLEDGWQPNIAAKAAAPHAAAVLRRKFREEPGRVAASLAMNDSIRYDQSAGTLAEVGGPRYFRHKPDYSNLVFGFANKVARELAADFPDRLVSTYAYDWTEDVPRFKVEPNIVPFLTADRSQWFDPAFAAEDQDLMKRWVAAGPKVVGIYDYYYGAPFLVPRPTLYAVAQSIPFAHEAGIRAFYAEVFPNWGIDGPKSWLAAQLLWDVKQDPAALLDTYYREYWQEAAGPVREFFELCDRQWREQPLPSYWLKYYMDEQQALLFPPEARRALRAKLEAARGLVRQDLTRSRLELTSAAFAVTEAFCEFNEAREQLSRLALAAKLDPESVTAAAEAMRSARSKLEGLITRTEAGQPLALAAKLLGEFTRNDPRRRALWRFIKDEGLRSEEGGLRKDYRAAFGDLMTDEEWTRLRAARYGEARPDAGRQARELAIDGSLMRLALRDVADFTALDWVKSGYWRGHGEPYDTRKISLLKPEGGIRFEGCKQETLSQWHPAEAGAWYAATVKVRARVSPGNMTFLIVTLLDEKGKYIGLGSVDRLPVGEWNSPVELAVLVNAPKDAKQIGLGVRVLNQVNDPTSPPGYEGHGDFAEFSTFSLKKL